LAPVLFIGGAFYLLQLIFSTVFSFSWSEQALSPGQVVSLSTLFLFLVQVLCFGHRISAHASVFGVFLGPRLVLLFGHATPAHRLLFIFFVRLDLSLVSPLCRGEPLYSAAQSEFYRRPISVLVDFSLPVRALSPVLRVAVLAARARAAELFRFPAQLSGSDCLSLSIFFFSLQIPLRFYFST
jgi:hypothetical protein